MKIYHDLVRINNQEQIILYVEYPAEYEFSLDFNTFKKNVASVSDKIREYVLKNLGNISDNSVLLILNGVVVGTLMLSQLTTPKVSNNKPQTTQVEQIQQESTNTEEVVALETEDKKNEDVAKEENKEVTQQSEENTSNNNTSNNTPNAKTTSKKSTTSSSTNKKTTSSSSNKALSNTNTSTNKNTNTNSSIPGKMINVKLASGQVIQVSLEDYVVGVVGAEMPAEFHTEALKAQAVASRTYALKKTASGGTISATISDQVYNTDAQLRSKWGSSYDKYYNKIKNAVVSTKGQCLTHNGTYIEALFFSTSNGKTEDPIHVWGNSFPYLKSVDSPWDTSVKGFSQTKSISMNDISNKLGVSLTSISQISINSKTAGNRVNSITVCGKEFTGVKIRQLLGLRSADFSISQNGNNIVFTTKGYGHGVGMSQYGANGMAKSGYSYRQILQHYYTGVSIVTK